MILLDTHVWVWWVQGDTRLHQSVVEFLDGLPAKSVAVSAISFWEIALLSRRGRINLPDAPDVWLEIAATDPRLDVLSVTPEVAVCAAMLPENHKDPADRILIAHAIIGGHTLITEDAAIHSYENVRTLRPAALISESPNG